MPHPTPAHPGTGRPTRTPDATRSATTRPTDATVRERHRPNGAPLEPPKNPHHRSLVLGADRNLWTSPPGEDPTATGRTSVGVGS
jgi:hypothetical protein